MNWRFFNQVSKTVSGPACTEQFHNNPYSNIVCDSGLYPLYCRKGYS